MFTPLSEKAFKWRADEERERETRTLEKTAAGLGRTGVSLSIKTIISVPPRLIPSIDWLITCQQITSLYSALRGYCFCSIIPSGPSEKQGELESTSDSSGELLLCYAFKSASESRPLKMYQEWSLSGRSGLKLVSH